MYSHKTSSDKTANADLAVSFAADNATELANKLLEIKTNPALYELISKNTVEALRELYIGEDWCDLITYFISDPHNKTQWTKHINLSYLIC